MSLLNGKLICSATTGKLLCHPTTGKLLYGIDATTEPEYIKISASDFPQGFMDPMQIGDLWQGSGGPLPAHKTYLPASFINGPIEYSAVRNSSGTPGWEIPFSGGQLMEGPADGSLLGVWYQWDEYYPSGIRVDPPITVTFIEGP